MKCNGCGNNRLFVVEGKELRIVDKENPEQLDSFYVVTKSICGDEACLSTDIDLDPLHPSLVPFAGSFGLPLT